jgi:hypothetical protein
MGDPLNASRAAASAEPLTLPSTDTGAEQLAETRDALICQLLFAARDLAQGNILTSEYRGIPGRPAIVPEMAQVCSGCAMHSLGRQLVHTPSCHVGNVLSILDRICAAANAPMPNKFMPAEAMPGRRKEDDAPAQELDRAEAGNLPRGEFGEPWRNVRSDRHRLHAADGYLLAIVYGAPAEAQEYGDRIVACVNFCEGIPTAALERQQPLADMSRTIDQVIHLRRALPWLPEFQAVKG